MKRHNSYLAALLFLLSLMATNVGWGQTPGSLDMSFDPGDGFNAPVVAIALQPDGKILAGGFFYFYDHVERRTLARLYSDGSLDSSFHPGYGVDGGPIIALAVQPDGKILAVGQFNDYNTVSRRGIVRINSNGSLDGTFNPGTGFDGDVDALALLPNGKVIVTGKFSTFNGVPRNRIARLNPNGSLDGSFNPGAGFAGYVVDALALQPDGKVIAAGAFASFNGTPRNGIARLNADGSLDASYNPGGGFDLPVSALALQSDGKVIAAGSFTTFNGIPRGRIVRINSNGSMDATFNPGRGFGSNGVVTLALQSDGKIIAAGDFDFFGNTDRGNIARLNANGTLDTAFNPGTGSSREVYGLALQPDGRLLAVGEFSFFNGIPRNHIARLNNGPGTGSLHPAPAMAWTLHPNPAHNQITLASPRALRSCKVVGVDGKVALTQKGDPANTETEIDLTGLRPGLYVLQAEEWNGKVHRQRLVVE